MLQDNFKIIAFSSRLYIYKLSFVPKALVEWNAIPLEVRRSTALTLKNPSVNGGLRFNQICIFHLESVNETLYMPHFNT